MMLDSYKQVIKQASENMSSDIKKVLFEVIQARKVKSNRS